MKKSEWGVIAVIMVVSIGIAYFVGNALLGSSVQKPQNVAYEAAFSGSIDHQPDSAVFNSTAKNPTVQINIGNSSNQQPLSAGQ